MDTARLNEAFHTFAEASKTLEASYGLLQERIAKLTAELEQKNRRVRELELQHERNKRLIAMGEMAAKLVHEIRNPLCSIELYATMLERELAGSSHQELARGISTGIGGLNTILTNMLMFARPLRPAMKPLRLDEVAAECLSSLSPLLQSRSVRATTDLAPSEICGDRELLKQVFMNIAINAVQAQQNGGTLELAMRRENGSVLATIADSGSGIEPDLLERIFDPFFTTRENGTGLGLAITATIVQAHGGSIAVESEQGRGSTFRLVFPVKVGEPAHTEVSST